MKSKTNFNFTPVPYNINFSLYSFTLWKCLQIVEQILLLSEYTATMNVVPELNLKEIYLILNSVNYEDTYNGEFTQENSNIYFILRKTYIWLWVIKKLLKKYNQPKA